VAYDRAVPSRGRTRDACAIALVVIAGAIIGEGAIFARPELTRTAAFLFGDQSYSLFVGSEMMRGARLYRDVAYPYGAGPVYAYVGLARIFGNTPVVYLQFLLCASLINLALAYLLLRRAARVGVALFITLVGVLPVLLVPGALLGGYTSAFYIPIERMMLLAATLTWRPADDRSLARAVALGAIIGLGQTIRFGPGIVFLAVIVAFDVALRIAGRTSSTTALARSTLTMIGTFAAIEVTLLAAAFAILPRPVAIDVAWPRYMLGAFAPLASRVTGLPGWRVTVGQYFNPLAAGVLSGVSVALFVRGRADRSRVPAAAVFLPPLFYLAAALTFFQTEHHFRQFCWALPLGCAPALDERRWTRAVALVCWAPVLALMLTSAAPKRTPDLVDVICPNGWRLRTTRADKERIEGITSALRTIADTGGAGAVIFYPSGSGFYVAFGVPHTSRETWFFSGAIRPYEVTTLAHQYRQAAALVACRDNRSGPDRPYFRADLPQPVREAIEPRMAERLWRDDDCAVFRLRREE
jgi:hypothetical protein